MERRTLRLADVKDIPVQRRSSETLSVPSNPDSLFLRNGTRHRVTVCVTGVLLTPRLRSSDRNLISAPDPLLRADLVNVKEKYRGEGQVVRLRISSRSDVL
ncbi:uncharacterized [Tachysurus ichikawai]